MKAGTKLHISSLDVSFFKSGWNTFFLHVKMSADFQIPETLRTKEKLLLFWMRFHPLFRLFFSYGVFPTHDAAQLGLAHLLHASFSIAKCPLDMGGIRWCFSFKGAEHGEQKMSSGGYQKTFYLHVIKKYLSYTELKDCGYFDKMSRCMKTRLK